MFINAPICWFTLNSGGLDGTFTPDADGINGTVVYAGGATIVFSEFEDADADNVSIDTVNLALTKSNVNEGEQFSLEIDFINIDTLDQHTILVDWGNGETSMVTLGAGDRNHVFQYTYDDDNPTGTASDGYPISVSVTDEDGDSGNAATAITVNNVDPEIQSINLSAASINEAQSVTVTGTFSDPALGVGTEMFVGTAVWSDGVATTLTLNGVTGTFTTTRTFLDDHPSTGTPSDTFTVDITITDDDLGTDTETSAVLTVNNVDPVITDFVSDATFDDKAEEGDTVNISGSFTDVGTLDTHSAVVDWGDGSATEAITVVQGAGFGTISGSHIYTAGGVYTITVTLTDDDTGTDTDDTLAVVTGVGLNNGVLYIVGSNVDDMVMVEQTGTGLTAVHADFVPEPVRTFATADIDRIITYLCDGDDHMTIAGSVVTPIVVHGGDGNDHLHSGGSLAALLGEGGDDRLIGQSGRNVLIGGTGSDSLLGGSEQDVLIGGTTSSDSDDDALFGLLDTWGDTSTDYAARAIAFGALLDVFDDGEEDTLNGAGNLDLLYEGVLDVLRAVKKLETVN